MKMTNSQPPSTIGSTACSVPVVATDVADIVHLIPHGKPGSIVAVGDVNGLATTLISMATRLRKTARRGSFTRQWVSTDFSRQKMAERIATVYRE
jgi:glycosyltransferase involved in cell wall biosynthesis